MMRLSNRIAATALAAVMAVSMLTACGGGGGGSTGGNGNNPSSKPNNPNSSVTDDENGGNGNTGNTGNSGNTGNNGNTGDTGNSGGTGGSSTGNAVAWTSTNTYRYNQMLRGNKLYMDISYRITNSKGTETLGYLYTKNGAKSYTKLTDGDDESIAVYLDGNWAYLIFDEGEVVEGEKIAVKVKADDLEQEEAAEEMAIIKEATNMLLTPDQPNKVKKDTKTLNGNPYDVEIYQKTMKDGKSTETGTVTCYYQNKALKYIVYDSDLEYVRVTVTDMSEKPKEGLMKVPAGYYVIDEDGNVYDENGKLLYHGSKTSLSLLNK